MAFAHEIGGHPHAEATHGEAVDGLRRHVEKVARAPTQNAQERRQGAFLRAIGGTIEAPARGSAREEEGKGALEPWPARDEEGRAPTVSSADWPPQHIAEEDAER